MRTSASTSFPDRASQQLLPPQQLLRPSPLPRPRPSLRPLSLLAVVGLLFACPPPPEPDIEPEGCVDSDGDGRGEGCEPGLDCDDADPACAVNCDTCRADGALIALGDRRAGRAKAVIGFDDGSFLAAGHIREEGRSDNDVWLVRMQRDGSVRWQRRLGGAEDDTAEAVLQLPDRFMIVGSTKSFGAGGSDLWLVELDADGGLVRQRSLGGVGDDYGYAIVDTPRGPMIAGGTYSFGAGGQDAWLIALDDAGEIRWQKSYGGDGGDNIFTGELDGEQLLLVGATWSFGAGMNDMWAMATDLDGGVQWQTAIGGGEIDFAYAMANTAHGPLVVGTSYSFGPGMADVMAVQLDRQGGVVWARAVGSDDLDFAYAALRVDDTVVVAGSSYAAGQDNEELWALALDAQGVMQWELTLGHAARYDAANAVDLLGDELILAGSNETFDSEHHAMLFAAIKRDGTFPGACGFLGSAAAIEADVPEIERELTAVQGVETDAAFVDTNAEVTETGEPSMVFCPD